MVTIQEWVRHTFAQPGPKVFLEFGANKGEDTRWLAELPGVTMHAVEADPRNHPKVPSNVTLHKLAIAAHDGTCPLILSKERHGREWTLSSSIRKPKNHLTLMPEITFGDAVEVPCTTLDTFAEKNGIGAVSLIWADIQGAERDLVEGGQETLARTRYFYTECVDWEEYEGQVTLEELLAMLPRWSVVHRWEYDVLLKNEAMT